MGCLLLPKRPIGSLRLILKPDQAKGKGQSRGEDSNRSEGVYSFAYFSSERLKNIPILAKELSVYAETNNRCSREQWTG
jgi:hypothetical protein